MFDVTSSFIYECQERTMTPYRKFTIGGSDYSDLVETWPQIKRGSAVLKAGTLDVSLANPDGAMNEFYKGQYKLKDKIKFIIGADSSETIDLYTGEINKIIYENNLCIIKARDKLWDFSQRILGDGINPVLIPPTSQYLISDIAWTICTCYGGLDSTQGSNNVDIDYESFEAFAEQFSIDNVYGQTRYAGVKAIKALSDLAHMSDSAIWIEGDGKLVFKRFSEAGSSDIAMSGEHFSDLKISIDMDRMINKQWVYFDYAVESRYWVGNVFEIQSTSVETFGLHENVLKNQNIWYVDSISALNVAVRKSVIMHSPNKKFSFITGMNGIQTQIGDTVRLVEDFYDLTSGQGWTVEGVEYNMATMKNKFLLDEAFVVDAFYLDVSTLDGDHLLL